MPVVVDLRLVTLRHQLIVLTPRRKCRRRGHFLHYREILSTSTAFQLHNFARLNPDHVSVLENIESVELELLRVRIGRGQDTSLVCSGA
jgi:hypothetical protein